MAIGLSAAFLLPLVQMFLAALYFKVGSPWSSVLNAKVNVFKWRTAEPEEEEEDDDVELRQNLKWLRKNSDQLEKGRPPLRRGKSVEFDD